MREKKYSELKLNNGSRLLNVSMKNMPFSVVSVWINAGSKFDPLGQEGMAHFVEHLMMSKTKNEKDPYDRLLHLGEKGIFFNAFTTREIACYYHVQIDESIYQSIGMLVDGLNNSVIEKKDVLKEKKTIAGEIEQVKNNREEFIWHFMVESLFPDSRMGGSLFGNEKSLKSMRRSDIERFIEDNYIPENMTFVVFSNEPAEKLKSFFDGILRESGREEHYSLNKAGISLGPKLISIEKESGQQVCIGIGFRTDGIGTDEMLVLDFISEYLSNNWISVLVRRLRVESDMTYWVDGETAVFFDTGYLGISLTTDSKRLNNVLNVISEEIGKLRKEKIDDGILSKFKNNYISKIVRNSIDIDSLLWRYGYPVSLGRDIFDIDSHIESIKSISNHDIMMIANKYLRKENLSICLIGDVDESEVDGLL